MRHPRQVPPSFSGFPTVFFICAISLLLFQGRSIKIQGRFDPLSEADVLSIIMRRFVSLSARTKCSRSRSLGCSGEKATVARALANRQLLRDLNLRSSSSSIFAACRPHNAWHSPRAQLSMLNAVRIANTLPSKMQD